VQLRELDMVTLMSYDYHELNRTSINAPLSRENNQNPYTETVAENVERVLSQGCRPEKVVMGIPTYGRTYTLLNANNAGVDAAVEGPGDPGPFTLSQGSLGFNEVRHERERRKKTSKRLVVQSPLCPQICLIVSRSGWNIKHLAKNAAKIAVRGKQWISYDDPETVYQKVRSVTSAGRQHQQSLINLFVVFTRRRCLRCRRASAASCSGRLTLTTSAAVATTFPTR
jgi:GH18 family chitinase